MQVIAAQIEKSNSADNKGSLMCPYDQKEGAWSFEKNSLSLIESEFHASPFQQHLSTTDSLLIRLH